MREYIYLPEAEIAPAMGSRTQVDRPIAVISGVNTATPATLFVHVDHLNRPVMMTNAAKASVWSAIWTPWGTPFSISGAETNDARFPGQWFQLEAGLAYNWHRHYDPSLGRYTQPDPLGFVDGPSVYAYAGNSPYRYVDKDGRFYCPWCIRALIGGTIGGGADLGLQLWRNGGKLTCVNWWEVGGSAALGAGLANLPPNISQFIRDESGALKGDLKQALDALRTAARERNVEVTREMRREFHDEITGQGHEDYHSLLEAARDYLTSTLGPP